MTRLFPDVIGTPALQISPQHYGPLAAWVCRWAGLLGGSLVITEQMLQAGESAATTAKASEGGQQPAAVVMPPFILLLSPTFSLLMQAQEGVEVSESQLQPGVSTRWQPSPCDRPQRDRRWLQADPPPLSPGSEPCFPRPVPRPMGSHSDDQTVAAPAERPLATVLLSLTFDPKIIQAFAISLLTAPLEEFLPSGLQTALEDQLDHPLTPNKPEHQSQFTLALMAHCWAANCDEESLIAAEMLPPAPQPSSALAKLPQVVAPSRDASLDALPVALHIQQLTADLQAAWDVAHTAKRAKAEFLAMMSHELRTPLTCVIGMSATLLRWSLGPLSDRQRDYLQSIHDSGEHLLELIESILDLSQVEAGHAQLQVQQLSLRRLVNYCVQLFQEVAARAEIQLKTVLVLSADEDAFVADPQRLRQILIHLLDNAIKFTHAEGVVTVQVYRDRQGVIFKVSDTGIGIEPAQQPLLFQKFQQLEASHRRRYQGSGLGLALAQQQVQLHGGTITLESAPGVGSTFTVRLPSPPPLVATPPPSRPQGTVILLEDDDEVAALICELLTASGFKVFWLVESSTALEQILALKPVAAIVDLQIRSGEGEAVIEHIYQAQLKRRPRILALTSEGERPEKFVPPENPRQRADVYLFRPLQAEALVSQLCRLTEA